VSLARPLLIFQKSVAWVMYLECRSVAWLTDGTNWRLCWNYSQQIRTPTWRWSANLARIGRRSIPIAERSVQATQIHITNIRERRERFPAEAGGARAGGLFSVDFCAERFRTKW